MKALVSAISGFASPFRAPLAEARNYSLAKLQRDALAGATVAAVALPQSMAYALIANVPAQYGLYTLIIQSIIGCFFGGSRFLSNGPVITQSLLVAATATRIIDSSWNELFYLQLVVILTFMKGLIQMAFAVFKLGNLVRYISQSVIIGFTAGAAVLILAEQLHNFLGFGTPRSEYPGIVGIIHRLVQHIHLTQPVSVLIGVAVLVFVGIARLISPLFPAPLIAVVGSGLAVAWLAPETIHSVPPLPSGFIPFQLPRLERINWLQAETLIYGALALALLGLMETYSIAKSISNRSGERVDANAEMTSQGLMNSVSSFFQCMPGSASFGRSALNYQAGAATVFAGFFNGGLVLVVMLLLAGQAHYVPLSALAAILFVVAYGLIDWRFFHRIRRTSRSDAAVCLVTFTSTLVLPLQYSVYIGIVLNIALYLKQASRLHMAEMIDTGSGRYQERPLTDSTGSRQVLFIQLDGELFFGVADELDKRLTEIVRGGSRVVIIRLKRTHSVDSTVLQVLEKFTMAMRNRGNHVLLCGVRPDLMHVIRSYGLMSVIGKDNIFASSPGVFSSAKQALERARQLIGASIDADDLDDDDDGPLNYDI